LGCLFISHWHCNNNCFKIILKSKPPHFFVCHFVKAKMNKLRLALTSSRSLGSWYSIFAFSSHQSYFYNKVNKSAIFLSLINLFATLAPFVSAHLSNGISINSIIIQPNHHIKSNTNFSNILKSISFPFTLLINMSTFLLLFIVLYKHCCTG